MKNPKKAEIRRVLMGRAIVGEDGMLYPIPAGTIMRTPVGVGDGALSARLLGVTRRIRRYETKDGAARVRETAKKSMQHIGRGLALSEQPEAFACLIRYVLTRPVVLTFAIEDGVPVLTAWTGRGLMSRLALRRAIKAFERGLPDTMTASEGKSAEEDRAEKNAEKERKKAERAEKKQNRRGAVSAKADDANAAAKGDE